MALKLFGLINIIVDCQFTEASSSPDQDYSCAVYLYFQFSSSLRYLRDNLHTTFSPSKFIQYCNSLLPTDFWQEGLFLFCKPLFLTLDQKLVLRNILLLEID
jgi:hypothetical protein